MALTSTKHLPQLSPVSRPPPVGWRQVQCYGTAPSRPGREPWMSGQTTEIVWLEHADCGGSTSPRVYHHHRCAVPQVLTTEP